MAVFPQLMSRLCHLDSQVHAINEKMIIKVLRAYPQQALWGMMASIKSTAPLRKRRAQEILSRFKVRIVSFTCTACIKISHLV